MARWYSTFLHPQRIQRKENTQKQDTISDTSRSLVPLQKKRNRGVRLYPLTMQHQRDSSEMTTEAVVASSVVYVQNSISVHLICKKKQMTA